MQRVWSTNCCQILSLQAEKLCLKNKNKGMYMHYEVAKGIGRSKGIAFE
jgi:hypothetical protein